MGTEFSEILASLIDKYGVLGAAMVFLIYYVKSLGDKMTKLTDITNRSFGALMAMVDKDDRDDMNKTSKGGE